MSRKKDFRQEDILRALIWCDRHCCLCGKKCGPRIEVAHIDPKGSATLDNAIPLCFDCHQTTGSYNPRHPRGRSYRPAELKARREQIYEQHTANLIPPLLYRLCQGPNGRRLPDVGFTITHPGGPHWVKVRIRIAVAQGNRQLGPVESNHYDGTYIWNLNPGFGVNGHFALPTGVQLTGVEPVHARIDVWAIDIYEREHKLLPVGYVHSLRQSEDWYLEPSEQALGVEIKGTDQTK